MKCLTNSECAVNNPLKPTDCCKIIRAGKYSDKSFLQHVLGCIVVRGITDIHPSIILPVFWDDLAVLAALYPFTSFFIGKM